MFLSMGLDANLDKTKAMVCTSRFIWWDWGKVAYKRQATGGGRISGRGRRRGWVAPSAV